VASVHGSRASHDPRSRQEPQISALGLEHRVELPGWVPQQEAAQRVRKADALVLPSLFECGGAVVLEAIATGLPCTATRWADPPTTSTTPAACCSTRAREDRWSSSSLRPWSDSERTRLFGPRWGRLVAGESCESSTVNERSTGSWRSTPKRSRGGHLGPTHPGRSAGRNSQGPREA